ncbi:MAG: hypothetical protein DCC71_02155 [Proteobacteria bacterium]|nr:MAG: hypothetical protein DCC71_02155 [Pseudomonadota bacterium]
MDPRCEALLEELYTQTQQPGLDGQMHPVDLQTRISRAQGEFLHRFTLERGAERTLEIGMAYGFSTLYLLAAHAERGKGRHTAVDPFAVSHWNGIGLAKVRASGLEGSFRFFETTSLLALPPLAQAGERFDLVYIDGDHRFDAVIVDFHLSDPLCEVGGHIVLDDMWMPSIQWATRFLVRNFAYDVVPQPIANLLVLRKREDDRRPWDHFVPFPEEEEEAPRQRAKPWRKRVKRAVRRWRGGR